MVLNNTTDFVSIIDKPKATNNVWTKEPVIIPKQNTHLLFYLVKYFFPQYTWCLHQELDLIKFLLVKHFIINNTVHFSTLSIFSALIDIK